MKSAQQTVFSLGALLLSGSAFAADVNPISSPAVASAAVAGRASGYVELYGGYGWFSSNSDGSFPGPVYGGAGRLNVWLTPSFSTQIDAQTQWDRWGYSSGTEDLFTLSGSAHLSWRDPSRGLVGLLVSDGASDDWFDRSNYGNVAAEGQMYFNNLTLYGQAGVSVGLSGDAADDSGSVAYGYLQARYFLHPNLMIGAGVGYSSYHDDFESDQTWRWRLDAEWKLEGKPVALFASYQGQDELWTSGYHFNDQILLAGVKLMFGQDTLLANDRNGATLLDLSPLFGDSFAH